MGASCEMCAERPGKHSGALLGTIKEKTGVWLSSKVKEEKHDDIEQDGEGSTEEDGPKESITERMNALKTDLLNSDENLSSLFSGKK